MPSPIFKYIGGKTWLQQALQHQIQQLHIRSPFTAYCEPFAGGLGAFFGVVPLLTQLGIKQFHLNDINANIIQFYQMIQKDPHGIWGAFQTLEQQFQKLLPQRTSVTPKNVGDTKAWRPLLTDANQFFLEQRKQWNGSGSFNAQQAARLLFLQTHAFNGIYRENRMGKHNTPFNWHPVPIQMATIFQRIMDAHHCFSTGTITFTTGSYAALQWEDSNTLFYLDPPYCNEDIAQENAYHQDGFGWNDQEALLTCLQSTQQFLYSNHDGPRLRQAIETLLPHHQKILLSIGRRNNISAKKESRQNDKQELLMTGWKSTQLPTNSSI